MPSVKHDSTDRHTGRVALRSEKPRVKLLGRIAFFTITLAVAILVRHFSHYHPEHTLISHLPESYAICAELGKVYTVDQRQPNVDCFLVSKDRIKAMGSIDDIHAYWDIIQNQIVNKFYGGEEKAKKPVKILRIPRGNIVVPGLADAHAHLMMYGAKLELNLEAAVSIDEVLDLIETYVSSHSDVSADEDRWIEGFGWDQSKWVDWRGGFPNKTDLDARPLLANRPLALSRIDGHALWVSARALDLAAEVMPGGQWPTKVEGGEIIRGEDGEASGIFLDAAMAFIPIPVPSSDLMQRRAERAMKDALTVGLTSVHDAAVNVEMTQVFMRMADEGKLPIRVYAMANEDQTEYWGGRFNKLENYGRDERLNLKSIKLFADGALGSWGAALLEPYSDKPSTSGIMRYSADALFETVRQFWSDGWAINIHCIGDRANQIVLDVFEDLLRQNLHEAESRRPRIEHAQILRLEDIERAGRLGVIMSVQPTHATSDMWYAERRLGPERIKGAYAYRTLLKSSSSGVLPLGSDFPVEGINPLLGFYAAVSRLDIRGNSSHGPGGWFPSQRLTRLEALAGMSLHAAYASFAEHDLGSISPGKKADFVILDTDIMNDDAPFAEILSTKVEATIIDGRIAFGAI